LEFGLEHLFGENAARLGKDPSEESLDELQGDAIAEATRGDEFPFFLEVLDRLEITLRDEPLRFSFIEKHAAPDLGNNETDIVGDFVFRPDVTGRRAEPLVPAEQVAHQRGVEVNDREER